MARRHRIIAPILALLATALTIHTAAADSPDPSNSLRGGSTSIQFQTFGGGYRTPFRTSGIYLKHHLSDRTAVRVGIDFSFDEAYGESPPGTYEPQTENHDSYSVSLTGELERYVDATGPMAIFFGFGPYWQRTGYFSDYQSVSIGTSTYISYSKAETRTWEIGGSAALGFEWFFNRRLSLLGRVGASVGFGQRHAVYHDEYATNGVAVYSNTRRLDSDISTAGSSNAALGLSVYF